MLAGLTFEVDDDGWVDSPEHSFLVCRPESGGLPGWKRYRDSATQVSESKPDAKAWRVLKQPGLIVEFDVVRGKGDRCGACDSGRDNDDLIGPFDTLDIAERCVRCAERGAARPAA